MYASKYVSPEKVASLVHPGASVDYSLCLGHPYILDKALAARKDSLYDVKVRGANSLRPLDIIEQDPQAEHFQYSAWFFGPYERRLGTQKRCTYASLAYENGPIMYQKFLKPDFAFLTVSPMDETGYFTFSITNCMAQSLIKSAKVVAVEVNRNFPPLGGPENRIHISEVDYVVDSGDPAIPVIPIAKPDDTDKKIAAHIMTHIHDEATVQLGIGGLPNAIGEMIAESGVKNLGAHTEFLADSYSMLMEKGCMTNTHKTHDKGEIVFTFSGGSQHLYDWIWANQPILRPMPLNYSNNVSIIAGFENMISVNGCLTVDLWGQVCSESTSCRQISGTGGQLDFTIGAMQSLGGWSFLCCHSTRVDKTTGKLLSNIIPDQLPGYIITTPRSCVHCIATEWGIAELAGHSMWDRTEQLISIAHPDFREELIRAADERKIWKRSNKIGC